MVYHTESVRSPILKKYVAVKTIRRLCLQVLLLYISNLISGQAPSTAVHGKDMMGEEANVIIKTKEKV